MLKDMSHERMTELFSNMIHHITELVGSNDAYDTFVVAIGFTDEEFKKYIEEAYENCVEKSTSNTQELFVCDTCLQAIKSHKGCGDSMDYWPNKNDIEESKCDWCGKSGFYHLNIIRKVG